MLDVVILAAGKGTRMRSALPKVLHPIAGKPMLEHVVGAANTLEQSKVTVVIGHGGEAVRRYYDDTAIGFAEQQQQLGTGHAVLMALPQLQAESTVLILYGDVPLIAPETLRKLVEGVTEHTLALLTVHLQDPTGYGRILRDEAGEVSAIVEQKDATSDQLQITEVNTGIMAVKGHHLRNWLPALSNQNAQGEYYLTDIIKIARDSGVQIMTQQPNNEMEVMGVNDRRQQAQLERHYQQQQADKLMQAGVTLKDPQRFDCRGGLQVGCDVVIDVNCIFEGKVILGDGVVIGANCIIKDAVIGAGSEIKPNTLIEDADIGEQCDVGPFARVRPGTKLARGARLGNFVETKKANIGEGSKVNHLTYIGDCDIGRDVNVGAGTITCNYDGVNKFKTIIKDGAFIGSNTSLVAPVTVGEQATVGAGSTITSLVGDSELAVARGKQRNISGWKRPTKKKQQ